MGRCWALALLSIEAGWLDCRHETDTSLGNNEENQISHDVRSVLMSLRDAPKFQTCKMASEAL